MDSGGISGSFREFEKSFRRFYETCISFLEHVHKLLWGSGRIFKEVSRAVSTRLSVLRVSDDFRKFQGFNLRAFKEISVVLRGFQRRLRGFKKHPEVS